jgi:uncharacterized membrane protein
MPKQNYRFMKKQKEDARKTRQAQKQRRRQERPADVETLQAPELGDAKVPLTPPET